jgi:hypothetical protein
LGSSRGRVTRARRSVLTVCETGRGWVPNKWSAARCPNCKLGTPEGRITHDMSLSWPRASVSHQPTFITASGIVYSEPVRAVPPDWFIYESDFVQHPILDFSHIFIHQTCGTVWIVRCSSASRPRRATAITLDHGTAINHGIAHRETIFSLHREVIRRLSRSSSFRRQLSNTGLHSRNHPMSPKRHGCLIHPDIFAQGLARPKPPKQISHHPSSIHPPAA